MIIAVTGFEMSMIVALMLAAMVIGWAVVFLSTRRHIEAEITELRSMLYEHLRQQEEKLAKAAKASQALSVAPPAAAETQKPKPEKVEALKKPEPAPASPEQIPVETLMVIAGAVAAYLGKSVRLRSARMIQPGEMNPWSQQGRVYIQASHNLSLAQRAH